eukprot:s2718_g2.t1
MLIPQTKSCTEPPSVVTLRSYAVFVARLSSPPWYSGRCVQHCRGMPQQTIFKAQVTKGLRRVDQVERILDDDFHSSKSSNRCEFAMAWLSLVPLLLVEGKLPGSEQVAVDPQDVLDAAHWLVLQDQLLDVAADDCNFCFATSTATEKDLSQIQSFNCQRVSKADKDYSHLAELYGQAVDASWKSRLAQAKALCDKAKLSMDPVRRANLAACAWGQVLMRERECCNVPGPPYCVSNSHSKAARVAVLLMAFVVAFGAVCLGKCGPCCEGFFVPSLALCSPPGPPKDEEDDAEEAKAAPHDAAHGSEATLKEKLTETWKGCEWAWTTRVDSGYPVGPLVQEESAAFQTELQLLEKVWVTHCQHFDFQEDSVLNQFEHFLSLWRSHCAALGDRRIPEVPQFGSKYGLMGHGLEEVYKELLYGYLAWEDQLQQRIGDHPLSGSDTNKRLKVIAMYLLVWGEAGNLRFMPEMIYLITWILLRSDPPEQFRMFQEFMRRQQGESQGDGRRRRGPQASDDEGNDRGGSSGPPPEWAGPTSSSFEDWAIRARLWMATTKTKPTARGPMLLKALQGAPFENFKYLAKDPVWLASQTNAEELIQKMDTPEQYGEDKDEHRLESLARITYHLKRAKNENWREFFSRWEAALRKVREHKGWLRKNETKLSVSSLGVDTDVKKTPDSSNVLYVDQQDEGEISVEDEADFENFYAELHESAHGDEESEGLSEGEAAEILHTLIKKNRTFTQSLKAKKAVELSRGHGRCTNDKGFGKGGSKGGGEHFHLTVDGIRSLVRCYNCDQKGHIAKHCPNPKKDRAKSSNDKEVNLVEDHFENEEAFFCGMVETLSSTSSTERFPSELAPNLSQSARHFGGSDFVYQPEDQDFENSSGVRNVQRDYMRMFSDLFFFENHICNSVPKKSIEDTACATLDTGCQRSVIGIKTLEHLNKHIPSPLKVFTREVNNRFKSVHGTSETSKVALIPCSLGPKGCYLNPAIFESGFGVNAPLLLSLPFLLKSKSTLVVDPDHGLGLQMEQPKWFIPCHLGPSGALRIPLNHYNRRMIYHLHKFQHGSNTKEFEVLNVLCPAASGNLTAADFDSQRSAASPTGHGGCQQQAGSREFPLRGKQRVEEASCQATLDDSTVDSRLGTTCQDARGGGRGEPRYITDELYVVSSGDVTAEEPVIPTHYGSSDSSRSSSTRSAGGCDGLAPSVGTLSDLRMRNEDQGMDRLHSGKEQQQALLPLPEGDGEPMQVLRLVQQPALGRPTILAPHGRCDGQTSNQQPGLASDGSGDLRPSIVPQAREQPARESQDLQGLPKDPGSDQTREEGRGQHGGHVQAVPPAPGVSEIPEVEGKRLQQPRLSDKKLRKIKCALKQAISFWQQIREVFEASGMDEDTITCSLAKLNREVMEDLIQHPGGTKKTRQFAEAMNLTHRQLRTVAEVYNPACFGKLAKQHGLFPGLAFDLSLGTDLIDPRNQERVFNYLRTFKPGLVLIAPPCEMYSQLQNLCKNARARDPEKMLKFLKRKRHANKLLKFAIEVAQLCHELGLMFVLEHPWGATSWATKLMQTLLRHDGIYLSRISLLKFNDIVTKFINLIITNIYFTINKLTKFTPMDPETDNYQIPYMPETVTETVMDKNMEKILELKDYQTKRWKMMISLETETENLMETENYQDHEQPDYKISSEEPTKDLDIRVRRDF